MGTSWPWQQKHDPLFRGDSGDSVNVPSPNADASLVRHILYLGGAGRETPYLSASEDRTVAARFAGSAGKVWETRVPAIKTAGLGHVSRAELLRLLRGKGMGKAKWPSAYEVMQARRYVEEWLEHLVDFCDAGDLSDEDLKSLVDSLFVEA